MSVSMEKGSSEQKEYIDLRVECSLCGLIPLLGVRADTLPGRGINSGDTNRFLQTFVEIIFNRHNDNTHHGQATIGDAYAQSAWR